MPVAEAEFNFTVPYPKMTRENFARSKTPELTSISERGAEWQPTGLVLVPYMHDH
jgi:hypothetical protein